MRGWFAAYEDYKRSEHKSFRAYGLAAAEEPTAKFVAKTIEDSVRYVSYAAENGQTVDDFETFQHLVATYAPSQAKGVKGKNKANKSFAESKRDARSWTKAERKAFITFLLSLD